MSVEPRWPIRQRSAHIPMPINEPARRCKVCAADFLGLAAGKTGERGLWDEWGWYCSQECWDKHHPSVDVGTASAEGLPADGLRGQTTSRSRPGAGGQSVVPNEGERDEVAPLSDLPSASVSTEGHGE